MRPLTIDLDEQITLLLREVPNIQVKRVAAQDSAAAEALFDVAAGQRTQWDVLSWNLLLGRLDRSRLKVETWLKQKGHC